MQPASLIGKIPAVARVGRPYRKPASDFPEWLQFHTRYGDAATSNVRFNTRIRYGNSAHVVDGCRQKLNFAFKIAVKRYKLKRGYFSAAFRQSSSLYSMVPSPITYDVPFNHNTCIMDRQISDRRHIVPISI